MDRPFARIHTCPTGMRSAAAVVLAFILFTQPIFASDSWSRIRKLDQRVWLYVQLTDGKYLEGSFLHADESGMTLRTTSRGETAIERDSVALVAVNSSGRPWYSIPLAIAVGVAGGLAGYVVADKTTCTDRNSECKKGKGAIVVAFGVLPGALTYKVTKSKSGRKVIYRKKR